MSALSFAWAANPHEDTGAVDDDPGDDDPGDDDPGEDEDDGHVHAKRNYLVILIDDWGQDKAADYVASIPNYTPTYLPTMPSVARVSASGVRFSRAWGQPSCAMARASLMTGLHPTHHGLGFIPPDDHPGLDPTQYTTMAQRFLDQGYHTALFGKWQLGTEDAAGGVGLPVTSPFTAAPHPVRLGFETFHGFLGESVVSYNNWRRYDWDAETQTGTTAMETRHATRVTGEDALAWINAQGNDPWFAVVSFQAPHAALETGTASWSAGDLDPLCPIACTDCTPKDVYRVLTECVDIEIGGLLDNIAELDETLIVLASDNGTPFRVGGPPFTSAKMKTMTYEYGVRVPLYVADGETLVDGREKSNAPVVGAPRTVDLPVSLTDLLPTLYQAAFSEPVPVHPNGMPPDGEDIGACLTDATDPLCGLPYTHKYAERWGQPDLTGGLGRSGTVLGFDKMVATFPQPVAPLNALPAGCITRQYYDLSVDPLELTPITSWPAERTGALVDWFLDLHTGTGDWADGQPFCP